MHLETTFLHGDLDEEIYMKYVEGFTMKGKNELVCKLKKSLYGLKQSPRMLYWKFNTYMQGIGFTKIISYNCVYYKLVGDCVIYFFLYVDDVLIIGNEKESIRVVKTQLSSKFNRKDFGAPNFISGMEIKRDWSKIELSLN